MSRSIALLVVLFIKVAISNYHLVVAEVNDQNEHSQPIFATLRSSNRPMNNRLASTLQGTSIVDRVEDHANVDLDKIDGHRFILTYGSGIMGQLPMNTNPIDRMLIGKLLSHGKPIGLWSNEPRHDYHGLELLREDKEHSSIGDLSNKDVIGLQRIASLISSVLRDMKLADVERLYRYVYLMQAPYHDCDVCQSIEECVRHPVCDLLFVGL